MGEAAATPAWVLLAYLVSGMCFILALRGLSSPTSSQRGNRFGMFGMALAVGTTLVHYHPIGDGMLAGIALDYTLFAEILAAILVGATIGLVTARRIAMTAMPQLVAAFHSLVGMAAVLVGAAAFLNPDAFGIADMARDSLNKRLARLREGGEPSGASKGNRVGVRNKRGAGRL